MGAGQGSSDEESDPIWDRDERKPDVWQRLSRFTLACILGVLFCGTLLVFRPERAKQQSEADRHEALVQAHERVQAKLERKRKELHWLRTDLSYLEKVARDRLDRAKPGEFVIRVDRGTAAPPE